VPDRAGTDSLIASAAARVVLASQRKREVNVPQACWIATGGLAMRTTILAYVIAIVGLALIVAGAWDIYILSNEQTYEVTLSDYGVSIRTIAGGLIMIGSPRPFACCSRLTAGNSAGPIAGLPGPN
jgi:hypothetical protein